MRAVLCVVLVLGLCTLSSATTTFVANGFCQRYAAALFPVGPTVRSTSDGQYQLVAAVIDRALSGGAALGFTVAGILNTESQKPFFNGSRTGGVNFYTDTASRLSLRLKLIGFFACALGCRDNCTGLTFPAGGLSMGTAHTGMNINKQVWTDFINQVALTLYSFGVGNNTTPTDETPYILANMGQFLRGAPSSSVGGPICTAADCDPYTPFAEFWVGQDDIANPGTLVLRWLNNAGGYTASIAVGGNIHWNLSPAHTVTETDSAYAIKSGGFVSGTTNTGISTYTRAFPTMGTYYFFCSVTSHQATMRGTIYVGTSPPSSGATTVPTLAVVLAAVVAGITLRRRI